MASGIAALRQLRKGDLYKRLEQQSAALEAGLFAAASAARVKVQINRLGGQMTLFFSEQKGVDYQTALQSDKAKFARFFHLLLNQGIYLPPSQFEAFFLSTAHTAADIEKTIAAARIAFKKL
jgi:glutamate-1-semialdehyde 2,1-aminomutase